MPVYEFDCRRCGQPFEELVFSLARAEEVCCPTCGSPAVKKRVSAVAARIRDGALGAKAEGCTTGSL